VSIEDLRHPGGDKYWSRVASTVQIVQYLVSLFFSGKSLKLLPADVKFYC